MKTGIGCRQKKEMFIFSVSIPVQGPHPMGNGDLFYGLKLTECAANRSVPCSAKIKEAMEPYLHSRLNAHGMLRAAESGGIVPRTLCKNIASKWGKL